MKFTARVITIVLVLSLFAWGYGGQYIFVVRDLDLVITATSSTTVSEERRGHRRALFDLIEQRVLEPLRAANQ